MKQQVSRSRDGVPFSCLDLAKWVQFGGPGFAEEWVPCLRSECRDAREASFDAAKINGPENSRKIGTERAHGGIALAPRLDGHHKEYRCTGERRKNRLRSGDCQPEIGRAHV